MSTEVKINTLKEKVYKMTFAEVWDYCKKTDSLMYFRLKRRLMRELEMKDATLRQRKRQMKFYNPERKLIVKILNEYFTSSQFTEKALFPNAMTSFAH